MKSAFQDIQDNVVVKREELFPRSSNSEFEQDLSIADSYNGTVQDSSGDTIPRLRNRDEILFSSSDCSSYREYTVDGTTITEETEPWTNLDAGNSVQAEMVEIEGGPLGG